MKEIKFLKDLPIKLTNPATNVLTVVGGDIYYDAEGQRYGYLTLQNLNKSPIFAIQLFIREYSIDGKFIRENEYFEPYAYYVSGQFVNNNPVLLDKETEAIELTIIKVTFNNFNFVNGRMSHFKEEDYLPLYQTKAPFKKPGSAGKFTFTPSSAPVEQPQVQEEAPVVEQSSARHEAPASTVKEESVSTSSEEVRTEKAVFPETVAPVVEEEEEEQPQENIQVANFSRKQNPLFKLIPVLVGVAVLVVAIFVIMSSVTGGVNDFNRSISTTTRSLIEHVIRR